MLSWLALLPSIMSTGSSACWLPDPRVRQVSTRSLTRCYSVLFLFLQSLPVDYGSSIYMRVHESKVPCLSPICPHSAKSHSASHMKLSAAMLSCIERLLPYLAVR